MLKLRPMGEKVVGVTITGNPKNVEPEGVIVRFPGGQVTVTRATDTPDCDYWVHLTVNRPEDLAAEEDLQLGKLAAARLDIEGMHAVEADLGDFANPGLYHLAVRVERKESLT